MRRLFILYAFIAPAVLLVTLLMPRPASVQSASSEPEGPDQGSAPGQRQVVRAFYADEAQIALVSGWREPWEVRRDKGFLVIDAAPAEQAWLAGLGFVVVVDSDLTASYHRRLEPLPGQTGGIPGYPCYRTVEETLQAAYDLSAAYPNLATPLDIGDSWEKTAPGGLAGYDLLVLRLTNAAVPGPKPRLFVTTAIHARELATAELSTRFAEYLLQNYGLDADVTWLLDYHEIHLLLQTNPDGRKHAETGAFWRKNTNNDYCSNSSSRGADLNRNFSFYWNSCGTTGCSSGSQCSDTYRGPGPASEPETQAVENHLRAIFADTREPDIGAPAAITTTGLYLDLHSYSELVLWPWGFTATPPPNGPALQTLGRKLAYFNGYFPEQSIGLYPTDGTTDDFSYGELGIPGYTYELGTTFFQACSVFEATIVPDNMPSLIYAAKAVRAPYLLPAGPDISQITLSAGAVAPGTPVTITARVDDARFNNANGVEPVQAIAAAEFSLNTPLWLTPTAPLPQSLAPVDGNYDSSLEMVYGVLDTSGLTPGRHTLFLHGQDAAGNWGVVSAAFLFVVDPATAPRIQGTVRDAATSQPLAATVSAGRLFQIGSHPVTGAYELLVISGTYTLTATAPDYAPGAALVQAADGQVVTRDFALEPICVLWSDDVEGGNGGWTAESPWQISLEAAHSPLHSWSDSPGGNYANLRNTRLTSPAIDLSQATGVQLNFWQICDTEAGYDYCVVEANNGSGWVELARYDGPRAAWEEVTLDAGLLDGAAGARFRFRLTSDFSVTRDGWHLDDIRVLADNTTCRPLVLDRLNFLPTLSQP